MSSIPNFSGCHNCGDEPTVLQTVQVPTCNTVEDQGLCHSQKGKFYDKLTDDFIVPKEGKESNIKVCEANLWAKCQWVGICNGSEKIAVYPIISVANKSIKILNGCRSGEEIFGNPLPGTEFKEGTVIYPVPPQGCDSNFCERVAEAIRTCGAEGVYDLLKESEEICFTNILELEETERGHLFAGTMPDPCNCPDDYGYGEGSGSIGQPSDNLWRSCLRKLTKIWTNLGGRTLCFGDLPLYNKDNDPDNLARSVILDKKGCLSKGASINVCFNTDSVNEDGATAIVGCSDGEEVALLPECGYSIVGCCDEEGDNPKWFARPKGLSLYLLDEPIEVHAAAIQGSGENAGFGTTLPSTVNVTKSFDAALIPEKCKKVYALVDLFWKLANVNAGGGSSLSVDIFYNDVFYRKMYIVDSAFQENNAYNFVDMVPLDLAVPNSFVFRANRVQGNGNYRSLVRIIGFYA